MKTSQVAIERRKRKYLSKISYACRVTDESVYFTGVKNTENWPNKMILSEV
jgi:hypothetical protein